MPEIPTITINMDQPCTQCGRQGQTPSGLCLRCIADNITRGVPRMNIEIKERTREAAKHELGALLDENWPDVLKAYSEALSASDPDAVAPFKYSIGMNVVLSPRAGDIRVSAKISFSVKHADETDGITVDIQPRLPMGD